MKPVLRNHFLHLLQGRRSRKRRPEVRKASPAIKDHEKWLQPPRQWSLGSGDLSKGLSLKTASAADYDNYVCLTNSLTHFASESL